MNIRSIPARRGKNWMRAATHCIHGHEFDEHNTYYNEEGWRSCRACQRARETRRREANKS